MFHVKQYIRLFAPQATADGNKDYFSMDVLWFCAVLLISDERGCWRERFMAWP